MCSRSVTSPLLEAWLHALTVALVGCQHLPHAPEDPAVLQHALCQYSGSTFKSHGGMGAPTENAHIHSLSCFVLCSGQHLLQLLTSATRGAILLGSRHGHSTRARHDRGHAWLWLSAAQGTCKASCPDCCAPLQHRPLSCKALQGAEDGHPTIHASCVGMDGQAQTVRLGQLRSCWHVQVLSLVRMAFRGCNIHPQTMQHWILHQGSTAPSDPPGAEPSAPAGQKMAGGSPLHFMSLPALNALHRTKIGGRLPQHQDPDRGLPPDS